MLDQKHQILLVSLDLVEKVDGLLVVVEEVDIPLKVLAVVMVAHGMDLPWKILMVHLLVAHPVAPMIMVTQELKPLAVVVEHQD